MNGEMTRKYLRQVEHIRGRLCHIYSVIMKSINKMNLFIFILAQIQKSQPQSVKRVIITYSWDLITNH
jgi:hypothetical protein